METSLRTLCVCSQLCIMGNDNETKEYFHSQHQLEHLNFHYWVSSPCWIRFDPNSCCLFQSFWVPHALITLAKLKSYSPMLWKHMDCYCKWRKLSHCCFDLQPEFKQDKSNINNAVNFNSAQQLWETSAWGSMNRQWHWAIAAPWWAKSCSWIDRSRTFWSLLLFDGVPKYTGCIRGERICRALVCGKNCQRQCDSIVTSFQLLHGLLLYPSQAGALCRKCLMLLQSFLRQKRSWSASIWVCCQQGPEPDFPSAKTGRRLLSQYSSLKGRWGMATSYSAALPCHSVLLFHTH